LRDQYFNSVLQKNVRTNYMAHSDELAGFGDAELLNEIEDAPVAVGFNSLNKSVSDLNDAGIKPYLVRLSWGILEGDSTATTAIDWSGSVKLNKGTLALPKRIATAAFSKAGGSTAWATMPAICVASGA
jgi:hypothetical protein